MVIIAQFLVIIYLDHHGCPLYNVSDGELYYKVRQTHLVLLQEGNSLEHILDISMTPVTTFNSGDGGDVTSTECMCWSREYGKSCHYANKNQ